MGRDEKERRKRKTRGKRKRSFSSSSSSSSFFFFFLLLLNTTDDQDVKFREMKRAFVCVCFTRNLLIGDDESLRCWRNGKFLKFQNAREALPSRLVVSSFERSSFANFFQSDHQTQIISTSFFDKSQIVANGMFRVDRSFSNVFTRKIATLGRYHSVIQWKKN